MAETADFTLPELYALGKAVEMLQDKTLVELKARGVFDSYDFKGQDLARLKRKVSMAIGRRLVSIFGPAPHNADAKKKEAAQCEVIISRGHPACVKVSGRTLYFGSTYWINDPEHPHSGWECRLLGCSIGDAIGDVELLRSGGIVSATLATLQEVNF